MPSSRRTTALGAYLEGWRRALAAPYLVVGLLLATIAASLPLAAVVGDAIETRLGSSLDAESALSGWDESLSASLASEPGVVSTFTNEILGFGGTLAIFDRLADARTLPPSVIGTVAVYLVLWVVLSGGVIDRLARARSLGADFFLATCGRFTFRMMRFAVIAGAGYWILFRVVHPVLMNELVQAAAGSAQSEVRLLVTRGIGYALFLLLLAFFTLLADVARVRLVVEDRYSALAAWSAGWRFLRRRPGRMSALFLLNVAGLAVLTRLWLQVAPTGATADWVALGLSQLYLVGRLWARLAFIGSEVSFFQGELAHATYTAVPWPRWPDSASAEALRNLRQAQEPGRPTSRLR